MLSQMGIYASESSSRSGQSLCPIRVPRHGKTLVEIFANVLDCSIFIRDAGSASQMVGIGGMSRRG